MALAHQFQILLDTQGDNKVFKHEEVAKHSIWRLLLLLLLLDLLKLLDLLC